MRLNEAIEQLKILELPYKSGQDHKRHISVRLGIEALEIIQEIRTSKHLDKLVSTTLDKVFSRLPSETKEGQ